MSTCTSTQITPQSILSTPGCEAKILSISDQHCTILLTTPNKNETSDDSTAVTKSLFKMVVVPFHKDYLQENSINSSSSSPIVSYLSTYDFRLKSESGAEYSFYEATRKPLSALFQMWKNRKEGSFHIELIAPASEKQIRRATPAPSRCLILETPNLYEKVTGPYIQSIVESDSLSWLQHIIDGEKETERLLHDTEHWLLNIDTKWRSHPDPKTVPRSEWLNHPSVSDLYCLGIIKGKNVASLRDLRSHHIPMLKEMMKDGANTIHSVYGVPSNQIRIFVHYPPQFYHFHVHFTRLENEIGSTCERGHLVSDIIQNLELDSDFYVKRDITFKLGENDKLYGLIQAHENNIQDSDTK